MFVMPAILNSIVDKDYDKLKKLQQLIYHTDIESSEKELYRGIYYDYLKPEY